MTKSELREFRSLLTSLDRFEWVWSRASATELLEGDCSYVRYNKLLELIAARNAYTLRTACGVFSALSPNNDYLGNISDAATLLCAHARGEAIESFSVHTYGNNKRKAWRIASGADPLNEIVAPKTRNFFINLLDPADAHAVTIDGHMFNVWNGSRFPLASRDPATRVVGFTRRTYEIIAAEVRTFASDKARLPCQAQAVLWLTWRRLHGISKDRQLSFWDRDVEHAQLGFGRLS